LLPGLVIYTKPIGIIDIQISPAAGTALVGSHAEVADRIEEYARLGLTEFILSGYPHLEAASWLGEGVLPLLRARGRWRYPAEDPAPSQPGPERHPAAVP
jgi:hypothetical protein